MSNNSYEIFVTFSSVTEEIEALRYAYSIDAEVIWSRIDFVTKGLIINFRDPNHVEDFISKFGGLNFSDIDDVIVITCEGNAEYLNEWCKINLSKSWFIKSLGPRAIDSCKVILACEHDASLFMLSHVAD